MVGHGAGELIEPLDNRLLARAAFADGAERIDFAANAVEDAAINRLLGGERVHAVREAVEGLAFLGFGAGNRADAGNQPGNVGAQRSHGVADGLLFATHDLAVGAIVERALAGGDFRDGR